MNFVKVDIYFNFIGNFELLAEADEELLKALSRGRKPHRLMTLEELEYEREIDRRAYAKKERRGYSQRGRGTQRNLCGNII